MTGWPSESLIGGSSCTSGFPAMTGASGTAHPYREWHVHPLLLAGEAEGVHVAPAAGLNRQHQRRETQEHRRRVDAELRRMRGGLAVAERALRVDMQSETLAHIVWIHVVKHHSAASESDRIGGDGGGLPEPAVHVEHLVHHINVVGKEGGSQAHARNLP